MCISAYACMRVCLCVVHNCMSLSPQTSSPTFNSPTLTLITVIFVWPAPAPAPGHGRTVIFVWPAPAPAPAPGPGRTPVGAQGATRAAAAGEQGQGNTTRDKLPVTRDQLPLTRDLCSSKGGGGGGGHYVCGCVLGGECWALRDVCAGGEGCWHRIAWGSS